MRVKSRGTDADQNAFSLIELIVTVAIIAILAALVIPNISPADQAGHETVARQQQAALQTALDSWIVARSSEGGLAAARGAYTGNKLALLQNYLQEATYAALSGSGDTVTSTALNKANAYLEFSAWTAGGQQPIVQWINR
jgi:prepilin-type N-terminal cleavage/methylation domain-containing protein